MPLTADTAAEQEVESYLVALLNQQAFDKVGLIYGMGHAVYSISDPRAKTFRHFVRLIRRTNDFSCIYQFF